ncbi:MAG: aminotransferase class I/II-fold pyridoxal phosphate-dependent enzyme [Patescibacteria group bacterium]
METHWRSVVAECCGGIKFDAPGGGYSFSAVLEKERILDAQKVPGDPASALCTLSIADPAKKMPQGAMNAMLAYYDSATFPTRYTDNNGIPGTHERLAVFLNQQHIDGGVVFDTSWVQYSPGSIKRLLAEFIPALLFGSGTSLFFPDPSYAVIKSDINRRDATVINIALELQHDGKWLVNYDAMEKQLNGKKAVLYLNVPHNPTGFTFSYADWRHLISWAVRNKVVVVVDEAYTHLRFDGSVSVLSVEGWQQCCIVLQSISKGWNATGARFGWVVAHPIIIKAIRKVMDVKDSGGFGPLIAGALWCLDHFDFALKTRDEYFTSHQSLNHALSDVGFSPLMPQAGLCQLTKAPKSANGLLFANADECADWLRNVLRISVMPAKVGGQAWLRWSATIAPVAECGLVDEAAVITEVVRRLKNTEFVF